MNLHENTDESACQENLCIGLAMLIIVARRNYNIGDFVAVGETL
jgi:hypothetical protein